jgi:hypothetical protein
MDISRSHKVTPILLAQDKWFSSWGDGPLERHWERQEGFILEKMNAKNTYRWIQLVLC